MRVPYRVCLRFNTIHNTSITIKEPTWILCTRILEGADVGVCGLAWWRKPENSGGGGDRRHWTGNHYSATHLYQGSNPGRSGDKRMFYNCASQAPKPSLWVGSKSHCRAVPCRAEPICCTSNLIFINYASLKPYVSHIYFTVVNKTKIVFCSKLCFY